MIKVAGAHVVVFALSQRRRRDDAQNQRGAHLAVAEQGPEAFGAHKRGAVLAGELERLGVTRRVGSISVDYLNEVDETQVDRVARGVVEMAVDGC